MSLNKYFNTAAIGAVAIGAASFLANRLTDGAIPNVAGLMTYASTGLAALSYASTSLFMVDQKQEALITQFGRHIRTEKDAGLHFKAPWPFQVIAENIGTDLQQVTETLETKTSDDLFVKLPITIQYEIDDTGAYYFNNRKPLENMGKAVSAAVRTAASGKQFQDLYGDRDEISNAVIDHTKDDVAKYGISVKKIIIDEPTAPEAVQKAFNEVRASERLKEAARNKADAHFIEVVKKAEGDKQAQKLAGEGAADFRRAILNGYKSQIEELTSDGKVSREEALHIVMRSMELDALRDVGSNGNMIITPQDITARTDLAGINALRSLKSEVANDKGGKGPAPAAPAIA